MFSKGAPADAGNEKLTVAFLSKKSSWVPSYGNSTIRGTDFFFNLEKGLSGVSYPGPIAIEADQNLLALCEAAKGYILSKPEALDGVVHFQNGDRYRYRVVQSVEGKMASLRRLPSKACTIEELGPHEAIAALGMHKHLLSGGLVIVSGETGQGKSTLAAAMLKSRMEKFGSFCLTVEDPPEMPLHGRHGNGFCIQTDAKGDFAESMKGALRSFPAQSGSMLLLGEARDALSAAEALRASANGHLVFLTIHGTDPIWSLKRFVLMASASRTISENEALNLVSSSFRLCVQQRVKHLLGGVKLIENVILASRGSASPVANRIRDGRFETLSTLLAQQQTDAAAGRFTMFDAA